MNSQQYTIEELLEKESFRNWVRGEASAINQKYWDSWVAAQPENRETAKEAAKKITGFSLQLDIRTDSENAWARFSKRIQQEDPFNTEAARQDRKKSVNIKLKWIYRAAAGFLLILATGLSIYFGYSADLPSSEIQNGVTEHRVLTDYGERKTIKLGDGSLINLNANSELLYKVSEQNPTNINVELRGEAFFNISERTTDTQFPFQLKTEDGFVRVLGTKFSVSTRDDKTQVVLEEGSVEVTSYHLQNQNQRQLILKPNHLAEFDNLSDTLIVKWVNTAVYTSWKTDKLVFEHTPLPEVLKRIEHTFGVTIKIKDPTLKQRKLSGTIDNSKMNVILSTLSQTLSTPVKIDGEIVYIGE